MAIPALRAGILLTAGTVAVTAALYENHEPFREWADDVRGRAEAAWIGLKADVEEFREDLQNRGRRREAAWGARSGQWEGVSGGRDIEIQRPWRRRTRKSRSGSGEDREVTEATGTATGVESADAGVRRRRPSVHEGQFDVEKMAEAAIGAEEVLDMEGTKSRTSTETMRSAEDGDLRERAPLTSDTESSDAMDMESHDGMSIVSAPSEMAEYTPAASEEASVIMTPRSGPMTPTTEAGVMTPTSSTADELIDFDELRRLAEESDDGRSQTAGREEDGVSVVSADDMEDARSEISGVSEWSRVSRDAV